MISKESLPNHLCICVFTHPTNSGTAFAGGICHILANARKMTWSYLYRSCSGTLDTLNHPPAFLAAAFMHGLSIYLPSNHQVSSVLKVMTAATDSGESWDYATCVKACVLQIHYIYNDITYITS